MADNLVLPVPEALSAVYLVPSALDGTAARKRTVAALPAQVPDPVGTAARKMLEVGAVDVSVLASSAVPPLPGWLQELLGVAPELTKAVAEADAFVSFSATWPPGWPPVHESVARACAAALAAELDVPLVDAFVPQVLDPGQAIATLPDVDSQLKLTDWVLVFQSAGEDGLWMTTKGMGRFGMPELQLRNVPPQLGGPWTALLNGTAGRLLDLWLDALRERNGSAFAQIPAEIDVSEADVAAAYNAAPLGSGQCTVRLMIDPSPDEHADSFLTVQPPDGYPRSVGEYLADACREVFRNQGQEVRYLAPTETMRLAMQAARQTLPTARARFLAGDLPPRARLMVKHRITTPDGGEYPWAYVNSWNDPQKVLGNSAADAVHDPRVRAGRPIVIDVDKIVDWAIWTGGQGIVEGGETNRVALSEGKPHRG